MNNPIDSAPDWHSPEYPTTHNPVQHEGDDWIRGRAYNEEFSMEELGRRGNNDVRNVFPDDNSNDQSQHHVDVLEQNLETGFMYKNRIYDNQTASLTPNQLQSSVQDFGLDLD